MKKKKVIISERQFWFLISALSIGAIILGFHGAIVMMNKEPSFEVFFHSLYFTLQLFTLNASFSEVEIPSSLQIARFLAPICLATAAIKSVILLAKKELLFWKLSFQKNHIIINHVGEWARSFALAALKDNKTVVVIDNYANNSITLELEEHGAIIVDKAYAERTRPDRAKMVIALSDRNEDNFNLIDLCTNKATKILLKKNSFPKKNIGEQSGLIKLSENVIQFNEYETASRILFETHPPERYVVPEIEKDVPVPHVVIVGFSLLGEQFFRQTLLLAHYLTVDVRKTKITLIYDRRDEQRVQFYKNLPSDAKERIWDLEFISDDLEHLKIKDLGNKMLLSERSVIYVIADNDSLNLSLTYEFDKISDQISHIVCCLQQRNALIKKMELKKGISYFSMLEETASLDIESILTARLDRIPRKIHENYLIGKDMRSKPAIYPWEELTEHYKDLNRSCGDHYQVKLRNLFPKNPIVNKEMLELVISNEGALDKIAKLEHQRWEAFYFANGWEYASVRNDSKQVHNNLISYQNLSEEEKKWDKETVLALLGLLEHVNNQYAKKFGDSSLS